MIAQHCCRLWAAQGNALYLVGRNQGASRVHEACIDLNLVDQHESLLKDADTYLGGIDIVLIAHGTLPNQRQCEESVDLTFQEIHTNALSTVSLLTLSANLFEARRTGTLAVITSVAGDRGRASNYVYGSAKALVNSFLSGLRQRLHHANVVVLTIFGLSQTRWLGELLLQLNAVS
jgi:decaprenylphospho-beta-D-erythro-pentofuranosid-2-ulose 2-reductase